MATQERTFKEVLSLAKQLTPGQKLRLIGEIVLDLEEPLQRAEDGEKAAPFLIRVVEGFWREPQAQKKSMKHGKKKMGKLSSGRYMIPSAVVDIHTTIWYLNADARLSGRAKRFIDEAGRRGMPVLISSISLVEVVYLCEKGRITLDSLARLEEALRLQDSALRVADLTMAIALAVGRVIRDEVPDADRIIAGTALFFGVPVISRDRKIKTSAGKKRSGKDLTIDYRIQGPIRRQGRRALSGLRRWRDCPVH